MDAIIKLHEKISDTKLGVNREAVIKAVEEAALNAKPTIQLGNLPFEGVRR
jgi:NADH-quinone oxidoreductase subunit B